MKCVARTLSLALAVVLTCGHRNSLAQAAPPIAPPASSAPADPVVEAAEAWIGRALIIRGFYGGSTLNYDAKGHIAGDPPKPVDWTLAGMNIEKVARDDTGVLVLEGPRVASRYNPDQRLFERHPQKDERLKVILPAADAAVVKAALTTMFSVGIDPVVERAAPPYWRHYFFPALAWTGAENLGTVLTVTGATPPPGLVMPVMKTKEEPQMTGEAQRDHVKGTVQVRVAVGTDGVPRQITIRQPLGYGLDAKAVDAVAKARFQPGTLDGKPAPVEMIILQPFEVASGR